MAKKPTELPAAPELVVPLLKADTQIRERIEKGREILEGRRSTKDELNLLRKQYYTWDEYNSTLLEQMFSNREIVQEYSYYGITMIGGTSSFADDVSELVENINDKMRRLDSIVDRLPLYTSTRGMQDSSKPTEANIMNRDVFIVHGHNNALKETVARYVTQLELNPIVLHEQANAGRTIIEKFETDSNACFAVILLTPDDVGSLAQATTISECSKRARQNVIFEWGFFVAKLGRRNVCALVAEGVEIPSDMNGIAYLPLDQHGAWKMLLARELKAGGVEIDLNRAI